MGLGYSAGDVGPPTSRTKDLRTVAQPVASQLPGPLLGAEGSPLSSAVSPRKVIASSYECTVHRASFRLLLPIRRARVPRWSGGLVSSLTSAT